MVNRQGGSKTRTPDSGRPLRRWLIAILVLFLPASAWGGLVPMSTAQAAGGTDATCTETSIQSDLIAGGTWTLDCVASTTTIPFTTPVTSSSGTAALQVASGKQVVLDGGHSTTLFRITGGTLNLSGLTMQNGDLGTTAGAIYTNGALIVSNSIFTGNGVAACEMCGDLHGGAIFNDSGGTLTVRASTFANNHASSGGAIENHGQVLVSTSTFSGNGAVSGGALANSASMTVTSSVFTGNAISDPVMYSAGVGGAILNESTLTVTGSTFFGNRALVSLQ